MTPRFFLPLALIVCGNLLVSQAGGSVVFGQEKGTVPASPFPPSAEELSRMSWCELEAIYRQAQPGTLPHGFARGRVIYSSDKRLGGVSSQVAKVWWRGKNFDANCGSVINHWLVAKAIPARMYYGTGRIDGQPSIILDYSDSWRNWQDARDELRQVGPCLYLGAMFVGCAPQPKVFFVLDLGQK